MIGLAPRAIITVPMDLGARLPGRFDGCEGSSTDFGAALLTLGSPNSWPRLVVAAKNLPRPDTDAIIRNAVAIATP